MLYHWALVLAIWFRTWWLFWEHSFPSRNIAIVVERFAPLRTLPASRCNGQRGNSYSYDHNAKPVPIRPRESAGARGESRVTPPLGCQYSWEAWVSMTEFIKGEECRKAQWKNSRVWKCKGSERNDYRKLIKLATLSMLCTQLWSMAEIGIELNRAF